MEEANVGHNPLLPKARNRNETGFIVAADYTIDAPIQCIIITFIIVIIRFVVAMLTVS